MSFVRSAVAVLILAGIAAFVVIPGAIDRHPASIASLPLGTDEAFGVSGLEPRENQVGGGALRWLRPRSAFHFFAVGPGEILLEVRLRGHRTEVTVTANGAIVGVLPPGSTALDVRVRLTGTDLALGLETAGFDAPGRRLGVQIDTIRVQPAPPAKPGRTRLLLAIGVLTAIILGSQWLFGLSALHAAFVPFALFVFVLPAGLWRSSWLGIAFVMLLAVSLISALVARNARGSGFEKDLLQAALFTAISIHGLLPPSPLIDQSDAQLHGNKLATVARGNLFPTSRTDHKPPFDFPYGVSFYAVMTPFSGGEGNTRAVRDGAAVFSALSGALLAAFLSRRSASLAAFAITLWAFAPVNIRTMAFGNLSNVFAQAIFLVFLVLAAWMSPGRARVLVLTVLVTLTATAHLSSFIVVVALLFAALLVRVERSSSAVPPLAAGAVLAAAYFAVFVPMILPQAARLLSERGGSAGVLDPLRLPLEIVRLLGWPLTIAFVLAIGRGADLGSFPLLRSQCLALVLLAVAGLVSPIEVRYTLAFLPAVVVVAASHFESSTGSMFSGRVAASIVALFAIGHGTWVLVQLLPLFAAGLG